MFLLSLLGLGAICAVEKIHDTQTATLIKTTMKAGNVIFERWH